MVHQQYSGERVLFEFRESLTGCCPQLTAAFAIAKQVHVFQAGALLARCCCTEGSIPEWQSCHPSQSLLAVNALREFFPWLNIKYARKLWTSGRSRSRLHGLRWKTSWPTSWSVGALALRDGRKCLVVWRLWWIENVWMWATMNSCRFDPTLFRKH